MKNYDTEIYRSIIDSNLSSEDPVRDPAQELVDLDPDLTFPEVASILTGWAEHKLSTWFSDNEG